MGLLPPSWWKWSKAERQKALREHHMAQVEKLFDEWSYEVQNTCSWGSCDAPKVVWRIYNNHVLRAAAEWGVDEYTFGDGDMRKRTFSDRCLEELDWRAGGGIYNPTLSTGPR